MHILNLIYSRQIQALEPWLIQARNVSRIFQHIHKVTYRGIFAHIRAYFSRFRHIQDPGISGRNSVNQHLLFKPGSSFKSLFKSIWDIFFIFVSKKNIQHFSLQDSISIVTATIIITCHPRQRATHPTYPSTQTTQTRYPPHPCYKSQDVIHANMVPTLTTPTTPPTLARSPRQPRQHASHASTPSKLARHPQHPRQHEQHTISQARFKSFLL